MFLLIFFIVYFSLGMIFTLVVEMLSFFIKRGSEELQESIPSFNWSHRFWFIHLWPALLIFFYLTVKKDFKK
jgi:hypothetical protein